MPVRPGVPELLGELAARGIPAAVATSSRRVHALAHLGAAGILDRFRTVVARDDVNAPKPHPEPYLTAAKRLGVAPADCLAIEDSRRGHVGPWRRYADRDGARHCEADRRYRSTASP